MNRRGQLGNTRLLSIYLSVVLVVFAIVLGLAYTADFADSAAAGDDTWYGLYTDATSYEPGEAIRIYSSAPNTQTVFRLVRLDTAWTEITRTLPVTVAPQQSKVGSFIEFPGVTLSGTISFTLEGWYRPTVLGGDISVVAGQFGLTEAAAGIIISNTGELGAYVSDTPQTDISRLALAPTPLDFEPFLDTWYHLALTYDGAQVKLYANGVLVAGRAQTGPVAATTAPFRLGARTEAPGDLTGVIDGRLDSWALWPAALSEGQVQARHQLGLNTANPIPDLSKVVLYVDFEDDYPAVSDSSHNGYTATVYNHGNSNMAGVITDTSRAMRLNHDQIVDSGWDVTAVITIPVGSESGMYAIQALAGPDYLATQEGDVLSIRALAIRPPAAGPHADIAVVLPTNTWLAYTRWPQGYSEYSPGTGVTPRSRYPGGPTRPGGNNSAYDYMGDHVSLALFHGWQRPSREASPMPTGKAIADYSVRAPNSMYMVQWLDAHGYDYDVYSDDDFSQGVILASDYKVLMPHSHHEYWTDGMLASLTQFLDDGGSVAAPAGNIFTWRSVFNDRQVMEARKFNIMQALGEIELNSAIDGLFMGTLRQAAACNASGDSFQELGVSVHLIKPCTNKPFCFGQWEVQNSSHWLWQDSGLSDEDLVGIGRPSTEITPTYAVGHEADTWVTGIPIANLAPGTDPVILAEGVNFGPPGYEDDTGKVNTLLDHIGEVVTCDNVIDTILNPEAGGANPPATRAGTILYFKHAGGGHILVIGASATPWALESDAALSGLLQRGLDCFIHNQGCGYTVSLPSVQKKP